MHQQEQFKRELPDISRLTERERSRILDILLALFYAKIVKEEKRGVRNIR
jgi:hypothetical protein